MSGAATRNGLVWLDNERDETMGKRKKKDDVGAVGGGEGGGKAGGEGGGENGLPVTLTELLHHEADEADEAAGGLRPRGEGDEEASTPGPEHDDEPAPASEPAEPHSLECGHCGGDAITGIMFTDGDGADVGCATCKFPGHVSVDEPDSEEGMATAVWMPTEDPAARCVLKDCEECVIVYERITLTDRRPVEINVAEWPQIAYASSPDARIWIAVLEHKDGRRIVHGRREKGAEGTARATYAGWLVEPAPKPVEQPAPATPTPTPIASPVAIAAAMLVVMANIEKRTIDFIRGVGTEIGALQIASDCIASLPAERL